MIGKDPGFGNILREWQGCRLWLPRFGLVVDGYGIRRRLIWPGSYLVRISRTYGRPIYRAMPLG